MTEQWLVWRVKVVNTSLRAIALELSRLAPLQRIWQSSLAADVQSGFERVVAFLNAVFWRSRILRQISAIFLILIFLFTFRSLWHLGNGSPLPFHLTNVALHALVTWLFVHVVAAHVFYQQLQQLCAGMLFALHPVHTEAVGTNFGS